MEQLAHQEAAGTLDFPNARLIRYLREGFAWIPGRLPRELDEALSVAEAFEQGTASRRKLKSAIVRHREDFANRHRAPGDWDEQIAWAQRLGIDAMEAALGGDPRSTIEPLRGLLDFLKTAKPASDEDLSAFLQDRFGSAG